MSPHAIRGTDTRYTVESVERGREVDGRRIVWAKVVLDLACELHVVMLNVFFHECITQVGQLFVAN